MGALATYRSSPAPLLAIVADDKEWLPKGAADEKGWWEEDPEAETEVEETGVEVRLASSTEELLAESDIVALATTAPNPIVEASWWKSGAHINSVGSHAPALRELDTASIQRAKVICDQTQACLLEAGDIMIPIQEGDYSAAQIHGELGAVINGTTVGRENDEEVTLFKSVGLAIQDLSCARLVYDLAVENGVGTEFEF